MYRLARLSLGHRAVTALVTVAVAVLGVLSLGSLKQELIPSVQLPAAAVVAVYPGSSPEVVEDQVSAPLENAVRGVRGVDEVASTSSTNLSVTSVTFDFGTDMDLAAQQLRTAVDRLAGSLPGDVQPEVVTGSIDDLPVVQLAVAGGTDSADLAATVEDLLTPRLEEIADVREVTVSGAAEREITLEVDLPTLVAAGLGPDAVLSVLEDNGITLPAGTVTEGSQAYSVEVGSPVTSLEELTALPLRGEQGNVLPLGDVVEVTDGQAAETSLSRLDGAPALAVAITKTPEGNTVDVSHEVQEAVNDVAGSLDAAQVEVAVVFDQAPFIEESIENLATEGALGLVFAVLVILLFLASLRSTLVSAISIPLSLLVAFTLMQVTGYTLNLLTLSALTVAIGRVVDDSIVVIENIKRHLSYGEAKGEAVLGAVREVGGAITSSTVATVAVFVPIGLVGGVVGELFRPFAMTVAIAMGASLFVALTIVPVLAFWFIRAPHDVDEDAAQARRTEAEAKERRGLWQRAYVPTLAASLRHPGLTVLAAVVLLGGTLALVPRLETNLLGDSGQDTLTVTQQFEPGTSLEAQDSASRTVEEALLGMPEVATVQTTVGSDSSTAAFTGGGGQPEASFSLTLAEDVDGVTGQDAVRVAVQDLLAGPATALTVSGADAAFGSSTVDLVVTAEDLDALTEAAQRTAEAAAEVDGALAVANNLASDQQIVDVTVDRAAAAAAGLTETAVAGTVSSLMSPSSIGSIDLGEGPVTVRAVLGEAPATVAELETVPLPGPQGPVLLAQVASIELVEVPSAITRVDGARSATVAVTPEGQDIGTLSADLTAVVSDLDLPAGAEVAIGGVASDQEEAFADLGLALLLAVIIVYVVMVATFNSLVQPLILLVSVPLASTGALVALLVTGTPLGVPALIGLLMLVGVVVSNAIVLIDLVNQYRARGRSLHEAVTEGSRKRLRPVVMTAAATIFALVPMALGVTGGGAFISQPLALVVIGGLISSTALTLLVVPVLYTLYEGRRERGRESRARRGRRGRAAAEA
ncbi:efflux RND transporter permease subunit [Actinotalea sp. C106]|uniref:efflux RND transporter permease subunit n=1 Tax=Actinotalea sp. C106 TaxID=2908644 RepID=UPI0020287868|nr:efflux RND transporter permease subunit [Actinotalea sp. C106]